MSWWRRTRRSETAETYLAGTPRRIGRKTPVNEIVFVALDSETTGFDTTKDRMLSLALTEIRGGRLHLARSQAWLLFQPQAKVTAAVSVHGILPAETAGGRAEAEVTLELLPRLTGAVLVGHHVNFDVAMMDAALKRHHRVKLRNPTLDTAKFAMHAVEAFAPTAYAGQREPTLDEVCAQCGIAPVERHTAEGDAFTTATLFLTMCARMQRRLNRPLCAGDLPLVAG